MTNKFKVGDTVKVTERGYTYSTYDEWADRNGLKNWKYPATTTANRDVVKVVAVALHSSHDSTVLLGVEYPNGRQAIIGARGVELLKPRGLQVGDRVRVIDRSLGHNIVIGSTAIVSVLDGDDSVVVFGTSRTGANIQQIVATKSLERIEDKPLDFTKPLETYEGTPVKLLATGGVDAKFPVLVLEGKATQPTKYDLNGKAKNGVVRRFIRNVEPKPVTKATKKPSAYYVNIYPGDHVGTGRFDSREAADAAYEGAIETLGREFTDTRIGVAKIQPGYYAE